MNLRFSVKQLRKTDIAAIAVCVALFSYLAYAATVGIGPADECYYFTVPQRLLMGDRLLIDDWHVSQLTSVLQLIPYRLITALLGSTEGVIINLRFLFLAVVLILYWFLYVQLREYGWIALFSAAIYSVNIPLTIMALNHYMMAIHGLTIVCVFLFLGKEQKKRPVLLLTGFSFACAVLSEPLLAFIYFFWCLLVLLRETANQKKSRLLEPYGFFLNRRTWLWTTSGIVLAALLFLAFLLSRSSLPELITGIPELFTDYEYAFFRDSGIKLFDFWKVWECFRYFGFFPPLVLIAIPVVCVIFNKSGHLEHWRTRLFLIAVLCLAAAYVSAALCASRNDIRRHGPVVSFYFYFHGFPLLLFGFDCYLLLKKKDPHMFCFWATGFLSSLMIDISSDLVMGLSVALTYPPVLLFLTALITELREEPVAVPTVQKKKNVKKKTAAIKKKTAETGAFWQKRALPLCLCVILCWEAFGVYSLVYFNLVERLLDFEGERLPMTAIVDRGPMKGIRTTEHINAVYNDMLADLDVIKENTGENDPVYVAELFPCCYLYLERPIATYSAWYVEEDSEVRQTRYWKLHPEKRPEYIYVPWYDVYFYKTYQERGRETWGTEKLAFLKTVCDYEVTEGTAGYILRVDNWRI